MSSPAPQNPHDYCQQRAAASGSSFYYSFLFLPQKQREAITALYAFCREVDDAVDECSEPAVARQKLAWWRQEIELLSGGSPQHPVTRALQQVSASFELPSEYLHEIIDGMEMDLDQNRYESFKDLNLYCHRVAGVVGSLAAEIFGYDDRQTLRFGHALGIAFQLTNILRDVREDAVRGRIYIPMDEMQRFDVTAADLLQPQTNERLRALLAAQWERARDAYDQAFALLPEVDRFRQRSSLIMANIYRTLLDEIRRDQFALLEHRIELTPVRKLWLAWKTVRSERRYARRMRRRRQSGA